MNINRIKTGYVAGGEYFSIKFILRRTVMPSTEIIKIYVDTI